jgi:DNA polymerase-3 subunit alpha
MAWLPTAVRLAEQQREARVTGQSDLFGAAGSDLDAEPDPQLSSRTWVEWEEAERLQGEKETLGLYLTGHPINSCDAEIDAMVGTRLGALLETARDRADRDQRTIAGLVVSVRHGKSSRGRMGSVLLDDRTGRIEVTVFAELYEKVRELLVPDRILVIAGTLSFDEYRDSWSLRAIEVRPLEQARAALADHLALTLDLRDSARHSDGTRVVLALKEVLAPFRGAGLPVRVDYRRPGARGRLLLGADWRIEPAEELLKRLRRLLGQAGAEVSYQRPQAVGSDPEAAAGRPRLTLVKT